MLHPSDALILTQRHALELEAEARATRLSRRARRARRSSGVPTAAARRLGWERPPGRPARGQLPLAQGA